MTDKIKAFLDSLITPACIIDKDLTLHYSNTDFLEMAGIASNDIRNGITLEKCVDLDIFNNDNNIIDKVLSSNEQIKLRDVTGKKSNGETLSLSVSLIPASLISDNNDWIILVFSYLPVENDIHEKYKKLYEEEKQECKKLAQLNLSLKKDVEEKSRELIKVYADFNQELEIARTVQDGLLPKELPNLISMRTSSVYIPTGKVGGDLYDIIITKNRKIALLIFDVSGHGVPAALIGAMAKILFAYYIEKGGTPAQIFSDINQRLSSFIQTGHYITAFLGIIDPSDNTMIYSRAGHPRPIVYHSQSREISLLQGDSIFIGHPALLNIAEYRNDITTLKWNDKLLLYTDGITESINREGQMYSQENLIATVEKFSTLEPEKLIEKIIEDNEKFRDGFTLEDDVSLLCIQIGCDEEILNKSGFEKDDMPGILSFNSYEEIEGICSIMLRELDKMGYPTQHFFQAHLCIHEILSNAVRHGNKYDSNKNAIVLYKVTLETFTISVLDEGEGFDYENLPDPLAEENITKDHGRGLFLVKNYMDEIKFNKKGNRIMAIKYLKKDV